MKSSLTASSWFHTRHLIDKKCKRRISANEDSCNIMQESRAFRGALRSPRFLHLQRNAHRQHRQESVSRTYLHERLQTKPTGTSTKARPIQCVPNCEYCLESLSPQLNCGFSNERTRNVSLKRADARNSLHASWTVFRSGRISSISSSSFWRYIMHSSRCGSLGIVMI